MTDAPSGALFALVFAAVVVWRLRRWPLTQCWRCRGQGKFTKGRRARRCSWCGGTGYWTRWSVKATRRKR